MLAVMLADSVPDSQSTPINLVHLNLRLCTEMVSLQCSHPYASCFKLQHQIRPQLQHQVRPQLQHQVRPQIRLHVRQGKSLGRGIRGSIPIHPRHFAHTTGTFWSVGTARHTAYTCAHVDVAHAVGASRSDRG